MIEAVVLAGLNHVLGQSAWARAKLTPFAGRHARIAMPPWQLGLVVSAAGLFEPAAAAAGPDVTIALPADTPLLALRGQERVMQAARVTGSAEFATELAFVLKNLRWDYEEDLSRVVGDIAAHRIAGSVAALADWQKQAVRNLTGNIAEYAAEENAMVVGATEFKAFADEVSRLRADLDRIERRAAAIHPGGIP
jgi:ubiquinone biosynthesis protein UbiJ